MKKLSIVGILLLALFNLESRAAEVAGVTFADSEVVASETLPLHGTGIRKVLFGIKVYAAAFYYPIKLTSEEELLKKPKKFFLKLKFLRDVSKEKILDSFSAGFEKNKVSLTQYAEPWKLISKAVDNLNKNEDLVFLFDGEKMTIKCKSQEVSINQIDFVPEMLKLWFGTPPNEDLKNGLLAR